MNDKWIAILQLVAAGIAIAQPQARAAYLAQIIGQSAAAYKEITGKPVDEALLKAYDPIT